MTLITHIHYTSDVGSDHVLFGTTKVPLREHHVNQRQPFLFLFFRDGFLSVQGVNGRMKSRLDQCAEDWPPERAAAANERIAKLFAPDTAVVPLPTALEALGVPAAETVAAACAQHVECMQSLPQAMSMALAGYITALTYVPGQGGDDAAPSQRLYRALLSEDAGELEQAKPFLFGLVSALRVLPRTRFKALYRVVVRPTSTVHRKGAIIAWASFVSTTPSQTHARTLAKEAASTGDAMPTVYSLTGDHVWGYDITPYSLARGEPEVVVEPGLEFFVAGVVATTQLVEVTLKTTPFFTLVISDIVKPNTTTVAPPLDAEDSGGAAESEGFLNSCVEVVAASEPKQPPPQKGVSLLQRFGAPPVTQSHSQFRGQRPTVSTMDQMSALARSVDTNPVSLIQNFETLQRCAGRMFADDTQSLREEAMYLNVYKIAAQCGSPLAQYKLGMFALSGFSTPINPSEAVMYFRAAALRGVRDAQLQLGICSEYETGLPYNEQEAFNSIQNSADRGCTAAQCHLGVCYRFGRFVQLDLGRALELFVQGSQANYPEAQAQLGLMYRDGVGVERNLSRAVQLLSMAAKKGCANAQSGLGECYLNGLGVAENKRYAVTLFGKAARNGGAHGDYCLGMCHQRGWGVPRKPAKAFNFFQRAAARGCPEAQLQLARMYENGTDVILKDQVASFKFLILAARRKHPEALLELGRRYASGRGVPASATNALGLFVEAAERGCAKAMYTMAQCYRKGTCVPVDAATGMRWLHLALEKGSPEAQCEMGKYHLTGAKVHGETFDKNTELAVTLLLASATSDNAEAQRILGTCLRDGVGTAVDPAGAVEWFRRASASGDADASYCLGQCHESGIGVPADAGKAVMCYQKAAQQGNRAAVEKLSGASQ